MFAQSQVPSKVAMKNALNLKPPIKLHECTSGTDNETPLMANNENKCETDGLVLTKFDQRNYW